MPNAISVAMIVKNEAAHLPECLAGLQGVADEICVLDTGSEDDTVSIAQSHGCRVGRFSWCSDFAAARNASLRLCTADWVFVLDADERIAPADAPSIRALTRHGRDRCYRFTSRNYTNAAHLTGFVPCAPGDPFSRGFPGWHPSTKVRLFPNGIDASFEGRVHELVNQSLSARGIAIFSTEIPIHHYPLTKTPEQLQQKQALYLELGREKLKEHPNDPRAAAELAAQYAEIGDYKNAAAAYRDAVRLEPTNPRWLEELGAVLLLMERRDEAQKALQLALTLDAESASAWRNLGIAHAAAHQWPPAINCFERLVALAPRHSDAYRHLALALEGAGRNEDAALTASEALRQDPRNSQALALYVNLMRGLGRCAEAKTFLNTLAPSPELREALISL